MYDDEMIEPEPAHTCTCTGGPAERHEKRQVKSDYGSKYACKLSATPIIPVSQVGGGCGAVATEPIRLATPSLASDSARLSVVVAVRRKPESANAMRFAREAERCAQKDPPDTFPLNTRHQPSTVPL